MKDFKRTINIIIGSIVAYLSILILSVAIDSSLLAVAGLVIAPAIIIYFNKKFTVKPIKYYSGLFGAVVAAFLVFGMSDSSNVNTVSTNGYDKTAIENTTESIKDESSDKIEDSSTDKDADKNEDSSKESINEEDTQVAKTESTSNSTNDLFKGYKLIEVDGGDLSGHREPNVVVDIGFGDREYWAFTNEYGQLVKVVAKQIILQDDSKEPVNSKGRYYNDEAKVPGVESKYLDEGHVIADSLGGVSNAYNITPQNSTLNRHGDQAYMEKAIRDAGGCTDFVAIITYPNTTTQIPSHYSYTYTLKGNVIKDEFDNVNPDEYNSKLQSNTSTSSSNNSSNNGSKVNSTTNSSNSSSSSTNNSSKNNNTTNNSSVNQSQSSSNSAGTVYWTPNGKSYHTTKSCSTLSRSKTILEGTIQESGKDDPCDRCH